LAVFDDWIRRLSGTPPKETGPSEDVVVTDLGNGKMPLVPKLELATEIRTGNGAVQSDVDPLIAEIIVIVRFPKQGPQTVDPLCERREETDLGVVARINAVAVTDG
jgi:hypothetical protein